MLKQGEEVFCYEEEKNKPNKIKERFIKFSLILIILIVVVFKFVIGIAIVGGSSMNPSLYHNDVVLYNRISTNYNSGDIVVIYIENQMIIKRVIGVPDDVVDIDKDNGSVYVDYVKLEEPYIEDKQTTWRDIPFPLIVPKDCYLVLGDNRDFSVDSRDSRIGMIKDRKIKGKVFKYFRF